MGKIHKIAVFICMLYGFLFPCAEPVLCLDCSGAIDLGCIHSALVSGDTSDSINTADTYRCTTWPETGPEHVYIIHPDVTCDIDAELRMYTADLDLFILTDCDESTCVAFGNVAVTHLSAAPGTYYIVVDGYERAAGSYTLYIRSCCSVTSTPTTTPTPMPSSTAIPAVYPITKTCILFFISFICILFLIRSHYPR